MNNTELQKLIATVLDQGRYTSFDQLVALCNSRLARSGSSPIPKRRIARAFLGLVRAGVVVRPADGTPPRSRDPARSRYRVRQVMDSWHVDRLHPDIPDHWHTIVTCTEAEARAILAALNELDRKARVRAIAMMSPKGRRVPKDKP